MKESKTVEIGDKKYTINELTVREIWNFGVETKKAFSKEESKSLKDARENSLKLEAALAEMDDSPERVKVSKDWEEAKKAELEAIAEHQEKEKETYIALAKDWLPRMLGVDFKSLYDMHPSDILELYNKFLEVNGAFLSILESLGLKEAGLSILEKFKLDLNKSYAALLVPDTPGR